MNLSYSPGVLIFQRIPSPSKGTSIRVKRLSTSLKSNSSSLERIESTTRLPSKTGWPLFPLNTGTTYPSAFKVECMVASKALSAKGLSIFWMKHPDPPGTRLIPSLMDQERPRPTSLFTTKMHDPADNFERSR